MTATVRYFAAAEEFAGTATEARSEGRLDELLAGIVRDHPKVEELLPRCSVLVNGARQKLDAAVPDGATVDILPPFAGG